MRSVEVQAQKTDMDWIGHREATGQAMVRKIDKNNRVKTEVGDVDGGRTR